MKLIKMQRNVCIKYIYIYIYIYALLLVFLLLIHMPMGYGGDDAVVAATIGNETLFENFVSRFLGNGRICTDVLANFFYRIPMLIWKILDSLVYLWIIRLLVFLFLEDTIENILITGVLTLMYPFSYLSSAGYIATSANYVYPVLGLLLISSVLKKVAIKQNVSVFEHGLAVCSVFYVTNHDQSAMVLIGGLVLANLLSKKMNLDGRTVQTLRRYLLVALLFYGFMFTMPGHINRMRDTTEMELWLPEYADWTLGKKLYHGYTSTVANLLYGDVKLFWLFCGLLVVVALRNNVIWKTIIALIPLGVMILAEQLGDSYFIGYYAHTNGMPELVPLEGSLLHYIPLVFSVIAVAAVFASVYLLVSDERRRWILICLLLLAAGSRWMMGLSPTIYASSFRTFTIFLYVLIIGCILLMQEVRETVRSSGK